MAPSTSLTTARLQSLPFELPVNPKTTFIDFLTTLFPRNKLLFKMPVRDLIFSTSLPRPEDS
jgi:hypothetical protein